MLDLMLDVQRRGPADRADLAQHAARVRGRRPHPHPPARQAHRRDQPEGILDVRRGGDHDRRDEAAARKYAHLRISRMDLGLSRQDRGHHRRQRRHRARGGRGVCGRGRQRGARGARRRARSARGGADREPTTASAHRASPATLRPPTGCAELIAAAAAIRRRRHPHQQCRHRLERDHRRGRRRQVAVLLGPARHGRGAPRRAGSCRR